MRKQARSLSGLFHIKIDHFLSLWDPRCYGYEVALTQQRNRESRIGALWGIAFAIGASLG